MDIFPKIVGRILDYDILVVGHIRWNKYFGESPDKPRGGPSTCTSTLVRGEGYVLIIDPTLRLMPDDYYFDLNRRTGLRPEQVTHLYATHDHMDHHAAFNYFPNAQWLAAAPVAEILRASKHIDGSRVQAVQGEFLPGLVAVPILGHTLSLHGVAFIHQGKKIIVAGDGVMTKNHFRDNTTMYETDAAMAAQSIMNLKESADLIIPGHDNLIVNR